MEGISKYEESFLKDSYHTPHSKKEDSQSELSYKKIAPQVLWQLLLVRSDETYTGMR